MVGHVASMRKTRTRREASSKKKDSGCLLVMDEERGVLKAIDEMQAEEVTTVPARASPPTRKSKFLRNRFAVATAAGQEIAQRSNNQVAEDEEDLEGVDRKVICEEIIRGGHVQAFVDFFYLTHRPGPFQDRTDIDLGEGRVEIDVPKREMLFIRDNLVAAESARRRGDTSAVFKAYNSLAKYYEDMNDYKTGVYFHEKCLEISRLTTDVKGEMSANHRLGLTYESMGDIVTATSFHERHEELARTLDIPEEHKVAGSALTKVYRKCAEEQEMYGSYENSIEFWTKSLEAARAAGDMAAVGQACYRLGKAHTELGNQMRAVSYLEDFQSICCNELDDLEGKGRACEALAAVYQSLGDDERALSLLQQYLDIATKTQNLEAQEAACSNLGVLKSRRGHHAKAKEFFERNFLISRNILSARQEGTTTARIDKSRALLGVAAGNEMAEEYINTVVNDLGALLDWKNNRVRPTKKKIDTKDS